ncbi:MAG TPA: DUF2520 domain-containing protein [Mycobacteriales bacterium]|jgi:predicted short-subunit dehydrogenase-like oxidoreductase (DUF2520 family)|nr:DUF2520 domain-containing protein [Mycobacteriales bacterium]
MSASKRRRLAVGVIGTGRVGAVLGAALAAAGHDVVAATGVSAGSVERARRLLPGVPLLPADEVAARADLVLVAVPDDVLGPVVAGLAELGVWRPGQLVVHTSGAHGAAVLAPAARAGARTIAAHPAMTFTGGPEDLGRLPGTTFGVTTDHLADAAALVADLGGDLVEVAEAARPLYHAALVVGANHLVTLVNEAADLLARAGVAEPGQVLRPLLTAALDNALRDGDAALTGPVSRGDAGTVAGHLRVLGEQAPDAVAGYAAMARLTAGRALAAHRITPTQAAPLLDVLATAESIPDPRTASSAPLAEPRGPARDALSAPVEPRPAAADRRTARSAAAEPRRTDAVTVPVRKRKGRAA